MQFQLNSEGGKKPVAILSSQILWFDFKQETPAWKIFLWSHKFSLLLIPQLKVSSHLIICNCAAVKVEWRSESDWFGLLIQFISDRRESNSLQITSFNPDILMPFRIFFLPLLASIYILKMKLEWLVPPNNNNQTSIRIIISFQLKLTYHLC